MNRRFGLIGYPLSHSFSPGYFEAKFAAEGLDGYSYQAIPLSSADMIPETLRQSFTGLNVTVPYKSEVIRWINAIDRDALVIGAVNTLVRIDVHAWKGYNTDAPAFSGTLLEWFGDTPLPARAIVLGSGGSAKAVCAALRKMYVEPVRVSRSSRGDISYEDLSPKLLAEATLIVQCTPLGMAPDMLGCPPFPFHLLDHRHALYDLVYNPAETVFLQRGRRQGARVKNGLEMLHRQADLAWSIWKSYDPDLS